MLNEEFLKDLMGKEDVSVDDKIKQIIAEHEADTRGLVQKKDELLGKEVKFKEQIASFDAAKGAYEKKIAELTEQLKKNNPEAHKQFYETQIADNKAKYEAKLQKLTADLDYYKQSHLKSLRDKAIEAGVKDLNFVPGLKDGFIARVLSMNDFEPTEIEGEGVKFLNKDHHTIEETISAFALTQEGKAYIANPSTGGGARGSGTVGGGTGGKTMSREQFNELQKSDPKKASEFFREGGRIL
jgi:hypothetical protein